MLVCKKFECSTGNARLHNMISIAYSWVQHSWSLINNELRGKGSTFEYTEEVTENLKTVVQKYWTSSVLSDVTWYIQSWSHEDRSSTRSAFTLNGLTFLCSSWQHWWHRLCWITWLNDSAVLFQVIFEIQFLCFGKESVSLEHVF